jgi:hypothetical protein
VALKKAGGVGRGSLWLAAVSSAAASDGYRQAPQDSTHRHLADAYTRKSCPGFEGLCPGGFSWQGGAAERKWPEETYPTVGGFRHEM